MIPFSILDLSPIAQGSTPSQALHNSLDLAQHAEKWGYQRYWVAEHHNMAGIASAATAVVVGYLAGGTETIRIGSGGIMLPNHSPLVIAEQFGTLASLYPNRIDLGLGRAPGADRATARALRRDPVSSADHFPEDIQELQSYLEPNQSGQKIQAIPGVGTRVPLWLLGSSLYSAQLAAHLGLPFAFAAHFAPSDLLAALNIYRRAFQPSSHLQEPYVMVAVNVFAAQTNGEARRQFTALQQSFINLRRGQPTPVPPPIEEIASYGSEFELAQVRQALAYSAVGSQSTVAATLQKMVAETQANELLLAGHFYDHAARLASFEIAAQVREELREVLPARNVSAAQTIAA